MKDYTPVINNPEFRYLWSSQVLSQVTINIMNFLLLIRLFNETGSPIATSMLWVAYALPAILIGPVAAAYVDMVDRRKMLMITNILQAVTIFLFAVSHKESVFLLYGVAMLYSLLNQFYVPAEQASLPAIVRKNYLAHANGLFFLTQQVAIVLGFGFAGLLFKTIGFTLSLYLCTFLLFLAFVSVSFLKEMKTSDSVPRSVEKAIIKFFERIIQGYRFIKDNHSILAPFVLLMSSQVSLTVVVVNIPIIAKQIFLIGTEFAGVAVAVPAGIGASVAALLIPKLLKTGTRKMKVIGSSLVTIAFSLIVASLIIPEIGNDFLRILVGVLTTIMIGAAFMGLIIPSQTFLQEKTPGGMRGRVFGNYWFMVAIATVFPVIFSGTVAELFGVRVLLILLAAVAFFGVFSFRRYGQRVLEEGFYFIPKINGNGKDKDE